MLRSLVRRARPLANYAAHQCHSGALARPLSPTGLTSRLQFAHDDLRNNKEVCSRDMRLLCTTPPQRTEYSGGAGTKVEEPEEVERLPLPPGVSGDKFGLYELEGTAKDWREVTGENAVVAVHGPEEGWVSAPGNPGASGGVFAVIAAGGSQHKVCAGDVLYLNRIEGDINEEVMFDEVLLVGAYDWSVFGRPVIRGASVVGRIEEQTLSGKVMVTKFKKRKGYLRRQGHRQPISRVRIEEVKFEFPGEEEIRPYNVRYDPGRPPKPNHTRWFF